MGEMMGKVVEVNLDTFVRWPRIKAAIVQLEHDTSFYNRVAHSFTKVVHYYEAIVIIVEGRLDYDTAMQMDFSAGMSNYNKILFGIKKFLSAVYRRR